ncbi:MAG: hypothetical protein COW00_01160 [Bdellovibrio sp. CG12_big_fil_rev_8_21_14_0_65_39_13]|nr:MAG: hypothetical protein COW78_10455 [Bdellovibrio sp. CG22_combo_CG10-13_8_21_14_all_39_27]PIQ62761.1 MAG: hypothetical protein COW00_01160 [Bdellovibrio sp. CG12_big_fil_rev_8_21_14_0_65_39_13]PIR36083.1 MAG: hypothetical protein COV37_05380 [Bdellovibrio sp. CG11_big_fil_rev_8_21_14_0_20_39_38]
MKILIGLALLFSMSALHAEDGLWKKPHSFDESIFKYIKPRLNKKKINPFEDIENLPPELQEKPIKKPDLNDIFSLNGGRGPGGGDGLLCTQSEANRFHGIYSYSYIQTRKNLFAENVDEHQFPNTSCIDNLNIIQAKLAEKNPILASGLKDFISSLPIQIDSKPNPRRIWTSLSEGDKLQCMGADIPDETKIVQTENCYKCQMFIRDYSETRPLIIYQYEKALIDKLKEEPQQCSYAFIHEWARDFIPNSKDIYFFTALLHSKDFHETGDLSLQNLDERTAQCLSELNKSSVLDSSSLSVYFDIINQVPPSVSEVEKYQIEMQQKLKEMRKLIDSQMEMMKKNKPLGYSQNQVDFMLNHTQKRMKEIDWSVLNKKISIAQALQEMMELSQFLPGAPNVEKDNTFPGLFLFMEPIMDPKYIPKFETGPSPYEGNNPKIEMIKTVPVEMKLKD